MSALRTVGVDRIGLHPVRWAALACLALACVAQARSGTREGLLRLSDGAEVGLLHLRATSPGRERVSRPVLLVPDLGLGPAVFSFRGRGLAETLARSGRDVFILDWRRTGTGRGLSHLVQQVLPAALEAAGGRRGGPVDVVAHGHAGTLVILASVEEARGRVGRVVAISTPVELAVPSAMLERLLEGRGALQDLALRPDGARTLELLLASGGAHPRGFWSHVRRDGLVNLGPRVAQELLAWMRSGSLVLGASDTLRERLARYDRPTLLFLPLADNFAHPEHAAPLRELAPGAAVRVRQLSRLDLLREDYTHLSVLQGLGAPHDVWAPALRFLEEGPP